MAKKNAHVPENNCKINLSTYVVEEETGINLNDKNIGHEHYKTIN